MRLSSKHFHFFTNVAKVSLIMKNIRRIILLSLYLIASNVGCTPKYLDIQAKVIRKEIPLPKNYFYLNAAWVSENLLAIVYDPEMMIPSPPNTLAILDISTNKMINIPMPEPSWSCTFGGNPIIVALFPDGNLAFNVNCNEELGGYVLLFKLEIKTGDQRQLFNLGWMLATHFSFISQDEFIQENAAGSPMSNELYKYSVTTQSKTRIVPNFLRASDPTWSSHEKLIAFWGTEKFPGNKPKGLYTWEDITGLVKYPWDLYVMDENADHVRMVFPLVANARGLEWSPVGNLLAFGGTIDNVEGIWLMDINNPKPIRIFEHAWLFSWSPDGKRIITIETKFPDEKNNNVPIKAYILQLPDCVFSGACK